MRPLHCATLINSRSHTVLMGLVYALVSASVLTCQLAGWIQCLLLLGVWLAYARQRRGCAIVAIGYDESWYYVDPCGERIRAQLGADTVVTRYFVLLHLREFSGQSKRLPLFFDSLVPDHYRQLKVVLADQV